MATSCQPTSRWTFLSCPTTLRWDFAIVHLLSGEHFPGSFFPTIEFPAQENPDVLGELILDQFGPSLPFLTKVNHTKIILIGWDVDKILKTSSTHLLVMMIFAFRMASFFLLLGTFFTFCASLLQLIPTLPNQLSFERQKSWPVENKSIFKFSKN